MSFFLSRVVVSAHAVWYLLLSGMLSGNLSIVAQTQSVFYVFSIARVTQNDGGKSPVANDGDKSPVASSIPKNEPACEVDSEVKAKDSKKQPPPNNVPSDPYVLILFVCCIFRFVKKY